MKIQLHRNLILAAGVAFLAAVAAKPAFSQTLVRDIEQPGLQPYQGTIEQPPILNSEDLYLFFPVPPAGKRLVVEQVSVRLSIREGNRAACELISSKPVTPGMTPARHYFNLPTFLYNSNSTDYLNIDEPLRLYADAPADRGGASLALHCRHVPGAAGGVGGSAGLFGMSATISGYLIDAVLQ